MLNWIRKKPNRPYVRLGIDIKEDVIRLLELNWLDNQYHITQQVILPTSNPRSAISALPLKNKSAVIALPDSVVIKKTIQIEAALQGWEQEEQILFEAEQHIAYSPEEFALDFQITGTNPENTALLDILLIAAPKTEIARRTQMMAASGLQVCAVDVESNALERAMTICRGERRSPTEIEKRDNHGRPPVAPTEEWLLSYGLALHGAANAN
jgi:type IV pilus assembly protein PilM